jgi:putative membrane protein insertion efficiency factor
VNTARHALILGIRLYRLVISPAKLFLFGQFGGCRFDPSCSTYALEAVSRHGALLGSWLTLKRIVRCHPWGGCGHDPVPDLKSNVQSPTSKIGRTSSASPTSKLSSGSRGSPPSLAHSTSAVPAE